MTARDTLPADPELLASRPPNPAATALPGWRGTDPDGGTWVLRALVPNTPWYHFDPDGYLAWHSQEEAEKANLVPLLPQNVNVDDEHYRRGYADAQAAVPAPLDPGAVSDADRVGDAETFLAHWAGGGRVSAEDREDFIAAWTGWHRGTDFDRECAERDAKEALDAYVSALAVERAELTAALADARSAAPAPLDPGNPEHLRRVLSYLDEVNGGGAVDVRSSLQDVQDWLIGEADRLDREQREAEQDASDRERAVAYAARRGLQDDKYEVDAALHIIRAERARQEVGQ